MNERTARLLKLGRELEVLRVSKENYTSWLNDGLNEVADGELKVSVVPCIDPEKRASDNSAQVADVIFHPNVWRDFPKMDEFKYYRGGIHINKLINARYIPFEPHLKQWKILQKICVHVNDKLFGHSDFGVEFGASFYLHNIASGTQFMYQEFHPHELYFGNFPAEILSIRGGESIKTKCP